MKGVAQPVLSREGTTQGDPLAMLMYAVGVLPLVRKLKERGFCTQTWYADDASAGGKVGPVREWLNALIQDGPMYGYYPEPSKSIVIVKDGKLEEARAAFAGLDMEFVEASRFLGGFLGKEDAVRHLLEEKVRKWVEAVEDLAEAAEVYPQDAYVCFIKSLQCEWGYVQRVVEGAAEAMDPLDKAIQDKFLPAVFGREMLSWEKELVKAAVKRGGLGIRCPTETAKDAYTRCRWRGQRRWWRQ